MKKEFIIGGLALGVVAYLAYKHYKKTATAPKSSTLGQPVTYSSANGTNCKCDNGSTGFCKSGDCSKCCGSYNEKQVQRKVYRF